MLYRLGLTVSEYVEHIYRQIPDLVKIVIGDDDHANTRAKPHYKTKAKPLGIPAWKVRVVSRAQMDDGRCPIMPF